MTALLQHSRHVRLHDSPVVIAPNNFVHKSLSNWSLNPFVGCLHGCRFCYVSDTTINRRKSSLQSYGIEQPVEGWGNYLLIRPFDRNAFLKSLAKAEATPISELKPDGNRAIMMCSTTDAYQVIKTDSAEHSKTLQTLAKSIRRDCLEAIRDHSSLNVRILTRSPLAKEDFDLFKTFGNRLLLGTSLPTLEPKLAKVYEPGVPDPRQRLKLLMQAHEQGINTFVAVAPVFPECSYERLVELFREIKKADPFTVFMEPVNLRLDIARRIQEEAQKAGYEIDMTPYTNREAWAHYAINKLQEAERAAEEVGITDQLHLWPDKDLGTRKVTSGQPNPEAYKAWLTKWWHRISEWPGKL